MTTPVALPADEAKTVDLNNDLYSLFLNTSGAKVFVTAVIRKADSDIADTGSVLYVRSLELMRNEIGEDSFTNSLLNDDIRTKLDSVFTAEFLRSELRVLNDDSPTDRFNTYYGALIFEASDIETILAIN